MEKKMDDPVWINGTNSLNTNRYKNYYHCIAFVPVLITGQYYSFFVLSSREFRRKFKIYYFGKNHYCRFIIWTLSISELERTSANWCKFSFSLCILYKDMFWKQKTIQLYGLKKECADILLYFTAFITPEVIT